MEGLDKFREAFKEFSDNYVIIGGTACDITMTDTEVRPRATHDIDMINYLIIKGSPATEGLFFYLTAGKTHPQCNQSIPIYNWQKTCVSH